MRPSPRRPFALALPLLTALAACAPPPASPAPPPPASPAAATPPATTTATTAPGKLAYPKTRATATVDTFFGVEVADPYRWLEDGTSPETKAWLTAQDDLTRKVLADLPGRDALRERLSALSYLERASAPLKRGNRVFYTRQEAKQEKRVVYWRELPAATGARGKAPTKAESAQGAPKENVLLDGASLSADGSTGLGLWKVSLDGKTLAYVVHPNNADAGVLHVKDVATGKVSDVDVIPGAKYANPQWTPKGDGFYYVALPMDPKIPAAELPGRSEVKFHKLGTAPAEDKVIFPATGNPETELEAHLSRDGHWLLVSVIRGASVPELHLRDMRKPNAAWVPLVKGHDGTVAALVWKDRIYLRTTEGAPRGRVFRVDPAKPERAGWEEIVPEDKEGVLEDVRVIGGHLALQYLRSARSEIQIRTLDGKPKGKGTVALPGIGSTWGVVGEPDDDVGYVYFTSFTTPGTILEVSIASGVAKPWYTIKAPVDPAAYEVEQVRYPSRDGTQVSMFVARRRGAPRDGSTPFMLSGYGGFTISLTPSFQTDVVAWLDAGGGVAIPNLRGGGEYGEAWHQAGMLTRKQNVFDDFIAAAEYLIKGGYTRADRLAIEGGSNGGLLVGAALTQRPELFRVALCAVPVLDMIRYPLFGDGKTWIAEYGSPQEEATFRALIGYSPYHRVKPGTAYPAVLMLSADADDRVAPLHAWKTVAALQAASTGAQPVLLRVERHSGHGGADQVKSRVEMFADSLSFALHAMGVKPALAQPSP
ncbi:prolyl oligopeptidase family serine peptidase [Chondromyces apiculatus]|uniref:prolyl oligopeptidase n=1 Tax=Chondromyces apiculatus DSM 436 TaxID=1192034 RepID=A0A017TAW9_9BACT|nr:prolyl oligopeptidase family serine peptidase [Chondromyces apiculatus]EYF06433.1 Prolyl endopeptidase [Chondromyces apiculatus DSM 436]